MGNEEIFENGPYYGSNTLPSLQGCARMWLEAAKLLDRVSIHIPHNLSFPLDAACRARNCSIADAIFQCPHKPLISLYGHNPALRSEARKHILCSSRASSFLLNCAQLMSKFALHFHVCIQYVHNTRSCGSVATMHRAVCMPASSSLPPARTFCSPLYRSLPSTVMSRNGVWLLQVVQLFR